MCHVPQDHEDDETREEACEAVDGTCYQSVSETVVKIEACTLLENKVYSKEIVTSVITEYYDK